MAGIFLFWRRSSYGWMVFAFFATQSFIGHIYGFITDLLSAPEFSYAEGEPGGLHELINLFVEAPDPEVHFVSMCGWLATLWVLGGARIREAFRISQKAGVITVGVAVVCLIPLLLVQIGAL
ncbi:MAG: hypothetical protein AAF597_17350 [Bacteroidota bacterium]